MNSIPKWQINRTYDFTEIETLDAKVKIDGKKIDILLDKENKYEGKHILTSMFLLKKYPIVMVSTVILTVIFLLLNPLYFVLYGILTSMLFILLVRFCAMHRVGTYLMIFWGIHLVVDFLLLGLIPIDIGINTQGNQFYIKSLFFGMLLTHLWLYIAIFVHKYYVVYNLQVRDENDVIVSSSWYIWQNCSMCNKKYIPFKKNCGVLK